MHIHAHTQRYEIQTVFLNQNLGTSKVNLQMVALSGIQEKKISKFV